MIEAKEAVELVLDKFVEENSETIENISLLISEAAMDGKTSVDVQILGGGFARTLSRFLSSKGFSVFHPPMASEYEAIPLVIKW